MHSNQSRQSIQLHFSLTHVMTFLSLPLFLAVLASISNVLEGSRLQFDRQAIRYVHLYRQWR
jgi:hypothetical protein